MYDAYIKSHNLKNITFGEVEELMAEDFRRYAEMRNGKGIVNIVKRLYNNILDFVKVSRKKDIVRNVFNAINYGHNHEGTVASRGQDWTNGYEFRGYFSRIRVYDRAISDTELNQLWNNGNGI